MSDYGIAEDENFIQNKFGYCFYALNDNHASIFRLFTHPEHRRKGNARKLLLYIISEIRDSGYVGDILINAEPWGDDNTVTRDDLIKFYESLGLTLMINNVVG